MTGLTFHQRSSRTTCPYCHGDLEGARSTCADCAVGYHLDCAEALGSCGTLGCQRELPGSPKVPRSRHPFVWLRPLLVGLSSLPVVVALNCADHQAALLAAGALASIISSVSSAVIVLLFRGRESESQGRSPTEPSSSARRPTLKGARSA